MSEMSREKALEVMNILRFGKFEEIINTQEIVNEALDMAIEALKEERPHGEWKLWNNPDDPHVRCTHCGTKFDQEDLYIGGCDYPNFCPNCGADMRKEGE